MNIIKKRLTTIAYVTLFASIAFSAQANGGAQNENEHEVEAILKLQSLAKPETPAITLAESNTSKENKPFFTNIGEIKEIQSLAVAAPQQIAETPKPTLPAIKPEVEVTITTKPVLAKKAGIPAKPVTKMSSEPVDNPPKSQMESNVILFRQLDKLRSENALLEQSLKNTELKNKLANSGSSDNSTFHVPSLSSVMPGGAGSGNQDIGTSQVYMISGVGTNVTALISLPSGGRANVRVGSYIAGLGVVRSVTLNEVEIQDKNKIFSLPFANEPQNISSLPNGVR